MESMTYKVRCTFASVLDPYQFTNGLIYTVCNGQIIDNRGEKSVCKYSSVDVLNRGLHSNFVLVDIK